MLLQICPFRVISERYQQDIIRLIKLGNEANVDLLLDRLENSMYTACLSDGDRVVGTATLKRPELTYRTYVLNQAELTYCPENFSLELGYVYIEKDFRNQGFAVSICQALLKYVPMEPIFATTRDDNYGMQSILQKFQFIPEGKPYSNRAKTKKLQLYVRKI